MISYKFTSRKDIECTEYGILIICHDHINAIQSLVRQKWHRISLHVMEIYKWYRTNPMYITNWINLPMRLKVTSYFNAFYFASNEIEYPTNSPILVWCHVCVPYENILYLLFWLYCLTHDIVCKTEIEIWRYTNDVVFISFGWSCMSILFIEIFYGIIIKWRVYGISFWCHSLSPVMKSQYHSMMSWLVLKIFLMKDNLIIIKDSFLSYEDTWSVYLLTKQSKWLYSGIK